MLYNNILFFNYFHNGDIYVSKEIINKIIIRVLAEYPNTIFSYAHNHDSILLADVPNLNHRELCHTNISNEHANLEMVGNMMCINTWYAQQNLRYMYDYGLTMDCLYAALNDSCKKLWGFSLDEISTEPSSFFPTIDYSKFEINNVQEWLNRFPQKKIFISNGQVMSGQAINFQLSPVINSIARNHPDKIFILSNKDGEPPAVPNVIYSSDIIRKNSGSDLNENSFISSNCDVIIGKASGPFTYALTQENIFRRKIKFLCFCTLPTQTQLAPTGVFWTGNIFKDKVKPMADIIFSQETDGNSVRNIIEQNIV